ncbi:hypothetical protein [Aeromicrobium sp. Root472D3]|uniref:hypothetical protein n=1 Tax=Aeromicrobium sp. Root472D3 TaxID=1736540 RepID=UPI0012F98714|nr:hypothetical protein [Aeromicrobium sp. Root472D3]
MSHESLPNNHKLLLQELLQLCEDNLGASTESAVLAVMHGWLVQTIDTVKAALVVHDAGLASATSPLVRAALENAVGMHWLRQVQDAGLGGLHNSHKRWAGNLKRALSAAEAQDLDPDDPKWPAAWAELVAQIESQPSAPHVKGGGNIAERFEVTELAHVYVAWLSETSLSHATQASATPYLEQVDDIYHLSRKPHASRGESLEGRCFVALDIALHAIAEVFDSEPLRLKLTDIEDRFAASAGDMNES